MKKIVIVLFLFLAVFCLSPIALAYPDPKADSFLTNGYLYNRKWPIPDISVVLKVSGNLGYTSSHRYTSPTFSTANINPTVFNFSQQFNLEWFINDTRIWSVTDIDHCSLNVRSNDAGNSYNKDLTSNITASGGMSFDTSLLTHGNYIMSLNCNLDNGSKIGDLFYFYLIPNSVTPAPIPESFLLNGNQNSGVSVSLKINDNLGIVSSRGINNAGYVTETMNPIAFKSASDMNIYVSTSGNTPGLFTRNNTNNNSSLLAQIGGLTRIPVPAEILTGGGKILSCAINVYKEGSGGSKITTLYVDVSSGPVTNEKILLPMSLAPGNYSFTLGCSLPSSGSALSDMVYTYVINSGGGCGVNCPKHLECVNNACASVPGAGANQCNVNADCAPKPKTQCNDKKDNDRDGKIDYSNDLGCVNVSDNDEINPKVDIKIKVLKW